MQSNNSILQSTLSPTPSQPNKNIVENSSLNANSIHIINNENDNTTTSTISILSENNYLSASPQPTNFRHNVTCENTPIRATTAYSGIQIQKENNSIGIQCDDTWSPKIQSKLLSKRNINEDASLLNNNKKKLEKPLTYEPMILISLSDYNALLKNQHENFTTQNLNDCSSSQPILESASNNVIRTIDPSSLNCLEQHRASPPPAISATDQAIFGSQSSRRYSNSSPINCNYSPAVREISNKTNNVNKSEIKSFLQQATGNNSVGVINQVPLSHNLHISEEVFDFHKILPFKDVNNLLDFDFKLIQSSIACQQFENYLQSILWMPEIKIKIKIAVSSLYSLMLQRKINYTGYKGKQPLKYLKSTSSILNVIISNSATENDNESKSKGDFDHKVRVMFQTHLQHTYDRLGGRNKKKQIILSPVPGIPNI